MMNPLSFNPLSELISRHKPNTALSIAVLGDVHLDHPKIPTSFIIERLDRIFTVEYLSKLDVIVINGDLFERRIAFDSESAYLTVRWIVRFLKLCAKFNITLHVLEGTPSHDNTQARWFGEMETICGMEVDFYYHDKIEITELKEGTGLSALWIPDEFSPSAEITQDIVKKLLITEGYETVDYTFIHGMFVYQEPIPSKASHDEVYYESITNNLIVINHIHTPSSSGKIRAPGSVCRLRHGEEETKGHLYIEHMPEGVVDFFIETENNARFDTVDMQNRDMVYVREYLDNRLSIKDPQYIKLKLRRSDIVLASIPELKKRYPTLNITTKVVDDDLPEVIGQGIIDKPILVSIRPETLPGLLMARMDKYPEPTKRAVEKLLSEPNK